MAKAETMFTPRRAYGPNDLLWKMKWGWNSSHSLHLGHRELGLFPILCNAGVKGKEKWMSLYQVEKI